LIIARQTIDVEKGQACLFDEIRAGAAMLVGAAGREKPGAFEPFSKRDSPSIRP
jgi:hypothetical protein